jgi:hypothetical protein
MTMSQKITGQSPIDGYLIKPGSKSSPTEIENILYTTLMKSVNLKNLIAKGTVPIAFSSTIADGK